MGKSTGVVIAAIAGLVIIECVALLKGIDGLVMSVIIAAIAGLGGFMVKSPLQKNGK